MSYAEEVKQRKVEYFEQIPPEFREFIEAYAYEKAHAYGAEEVDSMAGNIAADILPYIERYNKRKGIQ
jgi:hypothetical protein